MLSVSAFMIYFFSIIGLVCVDPDEDSHNRLNVGRVNYSTMCDDQRIEKLIEGLKNISMFMNDEKEFKDPREMPSVLQSINQPARGLLACSILVC